MNRLIFRHIDRADFLKGALATLMTSACAGKMPEEKKLIAAQPGEMPESACLRSRRELLRGVFNLDDQTKSKYSKDEVESYCQDSAARHLNRLLGGLPTDKVPVRAKFEEATKLADQAKASNYELASFKAEPYFLKVPFGSNLGVNFPDRERVCKVDFLVDRMFVPDYYKGSRRKDAFEKGTYIGNRNNLSFSFEFGGKMYKFVFSQGWMLTAPKRFSDMDERKEFEELSRIFKNRNISTFDALLNYFKAQSYSYSEGLSPLLRDSARQVPYESFEIYVDGKLQARHELVDHDPLADERFDFIQECSKKCREAVKQACASLCEEAADTVRLEEEKKKYIDSIAEPYRRIYEFFEPLLVSTVNFNRR